MARISENRASGRRAERSGPGMNSRQMVCKKKAWNRKGVSEIIADLLILAITVTLFSSIMWFVASMPGPAQKVYTDFSSDLKVNNNNGTAWVNITSKGGQSLESDRTNIYLFVNNSPITLHLTDGGITDPEWATGTTWSYFYDGDPAVDMSTSISVMVVDTVANTVVWSSPLMGGSQVAMNGPIVGDRGTNPSTLYAESSFQFYVEIFDPYNTLNDASVYINATSIGITDPIPLTDSGNNVFKSANFTANIAWNGAALTVNAKDTSENAVPPARFILTVLPANSGGGGSNPYQNYPGSLVQGTYPPDATGGEAGGDTGITFYYIKNSQGQITRNFTAGEQVYIELWSDTIQDAALQNIVNVIFPLTGAAMSPQSSSTAFAYKQDFSTFREFTYNFTAPSQDYTYTLELKVKDHSGKAVNIADSISIGGKDYPKLVTCKLDTSTGKLIPTTSFNHTDTLYLLIETRDVDLSAATVLLGDLQVCDFSGAYIIQKSALTYSAVPTYDRPMSSLFKTNGLNNATVAGGTAGGVYTLYLKLYDAYQGWWLPGTNTYTLKINSVEDNGTGNTYGEKYSSISCQFQVTAPLSTTDILASLGSGSFTWSASGASWTNNEIVWYKGGDQWDSTVIDDDPSSGPLALGLYDINGDGRLDAIVGSQSSTGPNIVWYENENLAGTQWSNARVISQPFDANAGKQASGGTNTNTNMGIINEDASVYATKNGGFQTSSDYICQNELCAQIAIADLNGDGKAEVIASFVHVVVYTTASGESSANSGNSFGMFFNRGIYVFWNDGAWTRTTLYSTNDWISNGTANSNGNPAAGDIAVGDLNQDGYPDVVAVYQDGTTRVWLNQWASQTGSLANRENGAFGASSYEFLGGTMNVGGTEPWDHNAQSEYLPLVEIADMDGNGYPDIVRTSMGDNNVYIFYTEPTAITPTTYAPDLEYTLDKNVNVTITGDKSNLLNVDNKYENLTEGYLNYANQTLYAQSTVDDNTGSALANLYYTDGQYYVVGPGTTMGLNGFFPTSYPYAGKTVSKAILQVSWTTSGTYHDTAAYLQYSTDGGKTWKNTTQLISGSGSANINLMSLGVDTWDELNGLRIRFVNPASSGGSVMFDHIGLDAQFAKSRVLEWQWEIPNTPMAFHSLNMTAKVSGTEPILIQYSVDNETWFNAFTISSQTYTTYSLLLPYTPNDHYYIRAVDTNNGTTDVVSDTLSINRLVINNYPQGVTWDPQFKVTSFNSNSPIITGLAIGDMDRTANTYGGLNDIVFCTSSTSNYAALFIATQYQLKAFDVKAVATPGLATSCSNSVYDTKNVQLGDVDGDKDLDIILVVGASYGQQPGTAPTLWLYYNNQQRDSGGRWMFTEEPINELGSESAINVQLGYIDLSIFLPVMGVVGIVAANVAVERLSKRRRT